MKDLWQYQPKENLNKYMLNLSKYQSESYLPKDYLAISKHFSAFQISNLCVLTPGPVLLLIDPLAGGDFIEAVFMPVCFMSLSVGLTSVKPRPSEAD